MERTLIIVAPCGCYGGALFKKNEEYKNLKHFVPEFKLITQISAVKPKPCTNNKQNSVREHDCKNGTLQNG